MFARLYVEALLVDENLADRVWELWDAGIITDGVAAWAWWLVLSEQRLISRIPRMRDEITG